MKKCNKCGLIKSKSDFHKDKSKKDGLCTICKDCKNKNRKEYYRNNKEKEQDRNKKYYYNNKTEILEKKKEWRENNREKLLKKKRQWYQNNKKKQRKKQKQWKSKNINKVRKYKRKWHKQRRKTDKLFKLSENIKCLIRNSIKERGWNKNTRTHRILKSNYEKLIEWLETNSNHSYDEGVEIDHVVPLSLCNNKKEIIALNHYSNLQLLSREENLNKNNTYIYNKNYKRVLENNPQPNLIKNIIERSNIKIKHE